MTLSTPSKQSSNAAEPLRVALIGTGSVGSGWAAAYLAKGHEVFAFDPSPDAPGKVHEFLKSTWNTLRELGLAEIPDAPLHKIHFCSLADAARVADIVHENGPESLAAKQSIFADIEKSARVDAIICSSSGGLPPSSLQANMISPGRFAIAHPFNPPHLVPLVEVIGGGRTDTVTVDRVMTIMAMLGKKPIRLKSERTAYLANRLQFALLREAAYCLHEGVADATAIDDAIRYALAPRWAVMGGLSTLALSGGAGGMARVIEQFGPAISKWWDDLGDVKLSPEIGQTLVQGAEALQDGRSMAEWAAQRDRKLVRLLKLLNEIDGKAS